MRSKSCGLVNLNRKKFCSSIISRLPWVHHTFGSRCRSNVFKSFLPRNYPMSVSSCAWRDSASCSAENMMTRNVDVTEPSKVVYLILDVAA
ncbi:hypothetical protein MRB53_002320 [Persea americana]|uniref:Uncharacterized protein n=1 Tax=Persea americana TaxID=3435 RepID=A0ACC2MU56_PERAE|nr:hypothetical protein MRB53_002320 [Persea americana]